MANTIQYTEYRVDGILYGWITPDGKLTNTDPNKQSKYDTK